MSAVRPFAYLLLLALLQLFSPPGAHPAGTGILKDSPFPEYEHTAATLIREARDRPMVAGKIAVPLTLESIRDTILGRNLDVRLSTISEQRAALEQVRTDAHFDPVLNAVVNYSHRNTYERTAEIGRIRKQDTDFEAMEQKFRERADMTMEERKQDFYSSMDATCVIIDGVIINPGECSSKFKYSVEEEAASMEMFGDRLPDSVTGDLGISTNLIWGQSLRVGLSSMWQENKYPSLGDYQALYAYDEGVDAYPYGNNPWTSTFSFRMETPLPFCKNFGEDGNYYSVLNRAATLQTQAERYYRAGTASAAVADAMRNWWELAGAACRLAVTGKARIHLEELVERTDRQLEAGETTSYAAVQVQAELQRWRNREEQAWSTYLSLSHRLAELLDMDPNTLFFPAGFGQAAAGSAPASFPDASQAASQTGTDDLEDRLENARKKRPELRSAGIDLRSKLLWEDFRETDLMPDISVSFSCSLSQSATYWGYESWTDSVMNIIDPDATSFYVGFVYQFPLGNRAAESAYTQSKLARSKSRLAYQQTENTIVKEVKQAGTAAENRARSLEYAGSGTALKRAAYEKATALREDGVAISEFELLSKFTEYVSTELRLINSAVLCRQADIDMLYAVGELVPEEWVGAEAVDSDSPYNLDATHSREETP